MRDTIMLPGGLGPHLTVRLHQPDKAPSQVRDDMYQLLTRCDNDFIPPLSKRSRIGQETWEPDHSHVNDRNDVIAYWTSIIQNVHVITIYHDRTLVGFLAFEDRFRWNGSVYIYVSTALTDPAWRGRKTTRRFAIPMLRYSLIHHRPLLAKTWSTNNASLTLLSSYAAKLHEVADDRGMGIGTVYWAATPAEFLRKLVIHRLRLASHRFNQFLKGTSEALGVT